MKKRDKGKDHLHEASIPLFEVKHSDKDEIKSPLQFWTKHKDRPEFVNLLEFAHDAPEKKRNPRWAGGFSARPELINQIAPAIQENLQLSPKGTAVKCLGYLRWWWRLFDTIELLSTESGVTTTPINDVRQLSDLHRQAAIDAGVTVHQMSFFRLIVDITRRALGARELHWIGPGARNPKRHLPPLDDFKLIWGQLKREWFSTIDKWQRAEQLLQGQQPIGATERTLLKNYSYFKEVEARIQLEGATFPTIKELRKGLTSYKYAEYSSVVMYEGHYPNPYEIRVALHLCLASSGWNPQPLFDLKVDTSSSATTRTPFLQEHPADSSRYVMRSPKTRSNSELINTGHWKTDRSSGAIILNIINRTWPLRVHVLNELANANEEYRSSLANDSKSEVINKILRKIIKLKNRSTSPWLYVSFKGTVEHLDDRNFSILGISRDTPKYSSGKFLDIVVNEVNKKRKKDNIQDLPYIVAGDFRDAFAAFTWKITGGSVLHVMKALNHKSLRSTTVYLDNSLINTQSINKYLKFLEILFEQIRTNNIIDITVISKIIEDGYVTDNEKRRITEYRNLKRSRIGIGCKDPFNPPERIDPNFSPNGKSMCSSHRCTLCYEHGVLLPESLPGLAMRMAELGWLKTHISVAAFTALEYQQEYENTEIALNIFPQQMVDNLILLWDERIANGLHRPIEFQAQTWRQHLDGKDR